MDSFSACKSYFVAEIKGNLIQRLLMSYTAGLIRVDGLFWFSITQVLHIFPISIPSKGTPREFDLIVKYPDR